MSSHCTCAGMIEKPVRQTQAMAYECLGEQSSEETTCYSEWC
jgi:hypothetical protein